MTRHPPLRSKTRARRARFRYAMGLARHWRRSGRPDLSAEWRWTARRALADMSRPRHGGSLGPRRWWRLVTIERLPPNLRIDAIQTCLMRGWHPGDAVYRLWPAFGRFEVVRLSGRKRPWADYAAHRKTAPGPDMSTPPRRRRSASARVIAARTSPARGSRAQSSLTSSTPPCADKVRPAGAKKDAAA